MVITAAEVAISKEDHPPGAVSGLYKVTMTRALNLHALTSHGAVGQNGVGRVRLIRSVNITATGNGQFVGQLCASFGNEQVIIAVLLAEVRTFRITAACTAPKGTALCQLPARHGVYLTKCDGIVGIRNHVGLAVLKIERGVNALLLQPDGFAPRSGRVSGGDHEIAAVAYIGGDHVVRAFIVTNGRGIDTKPRRGSVQRQLALTVQNITYLLPVHQVLGVENRYTWEILERGVNQIEI